MDNKDEKTFTDLFSSSKTEKNTKTFGDLLNNNGNVDSDTKIESKDDNISKNNETSSITFDNLFDQIPSEETENEEDNVVTEVNLFEQSEEKEEEPTKETSPTFNSIFDTTEADDTKISGSDASNIYQNEESNSETIKTDTETLQEDNINEQINISEFNLNPIFEDINKEEESSSQSNGIFNQNLSNFEEKTNEETQNDNPFFSSNNSNEDDINTENKSEVETHDEIQNEENIFANNPFMNTEEGSATEIKNDTSTPTDSIPEENPFFESINSDDENNLNINPFMNDDKLSIPEDKEQVTEATNTQPDENPFFAVTESTDKKEEETLNSNSVFTKNSKETSVSQEQTTPKSTSPFFEEEKKSEENPFFQNQINLIENQVPNTPNTNIDTTKSKHYNVKIVKKKEPLFKFILGVLSYALFIWLLLIGITLLVYVLDIKIRAAKGDYSSPTYNAYVVLTGSMLPEIQVYDVVVTKKVDASKLEEGDVITFASADPRYTGTIITHRIIKKNPPTETQGYTFQTQGDNNNVADNALVPEGNIYGKVILKIPKLGYLQEFLASDGGWIIVILIPCLAVMSYDIVKLVKGIKKKKYKNIKVQK